MTIRRLKPTDAEAYRALRLLGLRESPLAFGRAHSEEAPRPLSFFEDRLRWTDDNWTFGAFDARRLVGIVTLVRAPGKKERHKASIVGMYVCPDSRRKGVARRLLARAIRAAAELPGLRQLRLAVVEENHAALALYQNASFRLYGREPESLLHRGRFHAAKLLARPVSEAGPTGPDR